MSWSKPNFKKDIVTSVKNPNKFLLARALYPSSYVTYEAAIYCLKLNEVEPKNIHMAKERLNYSSNKESNLITNDLLANAFLKEPRKSSHYASYNGTIFTFIEREFTNLIGIEPSIRFGEEVLTTNIERTLIDVAISPQYVGGYKKACKIWNQFFLQNEINIQELATMYQKLNYKYPYWQRIGFILKNEANEKLANDWKQFFSKPQFSFFADRPFAKNWSYDNEWHIYYPN